MCKPVDGYSVKLHMWYQVPHKGGAKACDSFGGHCSLEIETIDSKGQRVREYLGFWPDSWRTNAPPSTPLKRLVRKILRWPKNLLIPSKARFTKYSDQPIPAIDPD